MTFPNWENSESIAQFDFRSLVVLCILCDLMLFCVVYCCVKYVVELCTYTFNFAQIVFLFVIGVDTDAIIMVTAARSNKQRQEIAQKYESIYGKVQMKNFITYNFLLL